jgi:hypothetical protein
MGGPPDGRRGGTAEYDRRVRVNERDTAAADQLSERAGISGDTRRDAGEPAGTHQPAAQHAERSDQHLDTRSTQLVFQLARLGEHDDRLVAAAVEVGGDQLELAVRAVAAARGVDEKDWTRQDAACRVFAAPL